MPEFDIIGQGISGGAPSGIFQALDPTYQLRQQQVQQNALTLKQAQLFADGLPQDANGNTDWNAAYSKAMSAGAYDLANQLVGTGIRMASLNDRSTLDNPRGQGGGASTGGSGLLTRFGSAEPAAGGGMIAPGAGGDDFGRAPGNGYSGVGQVGAGGIGTPAPIASARPADGAGAPGAAGNGLDPLDVYAHSIGSLESGNNYGALGQVQRNGAQAIGRYQVMSTNVPSWTKEVLGRAMTPAEFLASPDAQDQVFRAKFGQSLQQYSNPMDAASVWFSGRPLARAGNASDSLGTTVPAYIQRFAAGLQPAIAALRGGQGGGGQAPGAAAPAGGQGALISFGGPASVPAATPAAGSALPPAAAAQSAAQRPVKLDPNSSDLPPGIITDKQYAAAQGIVADAENMDPRDMTPESQRAATLATAIVERYRQQQSGGGAALASVPATPADPVTDSQVMHARGLIRNTSSYAPESLAPSVRAAVEKAKATVAQYEGQQATLPDAAGVAGPASAGTSNGIPTSSPDDKVPTGHHPFAPGGGGIKSAAIAPSSMYGRQLAAAGQLPAGGAVPISLGGSAGGSVPAVPAEPQGGQLMTFGGAPQASPAAPAAPALGNVPPEAAAALQRLRSNQGSAADAQVWGAYLKSVGGSLPAGQTGGTPAVGQGAAAASGGPDLPNLPAGYQQPGGGTRYVNDVLAKAAQFAAAGDPRAKVWEERAKQVQDQLTAAQTFRNNLALAQARADDRYNAANSPGAIAAAGQRAGLEAQERNKQTLVPSVQPDGSTIMIPQSDAVAAAQGGHPIVSAQPGYVTQGQGNLLAKLSDGSKAYQERQVASQRLDALSSLLETYQTGANSTAFNEAAANAKSLGIPVPASATLNPAAMQEFTKNGYANVLSSMKEQGNKQYAAEVQAAVNSNPNPDLQPEANAAMIAQMQGTKRWYDQNFRDYSQWYHGNKGASDDADFQTSWTDAHPLGAYVSAAGKDIAPTGIAQPAPGKMVDGQAYMTAGGKMRWSASSGRMVPFSGTTAPIFGATGGGNGSPPTASRNPPASAAPVPGARQARDGNWYTPDPNRPGKYMMVTR